MTTIHEWSLGNVAGQTGPQPKGPSIRKHHNIHLDIDQEREWGRARQHCIIALTLVFQSSEGACQGGVHWLVHAGWQPAHDAVLQEIWHGQQQNVGRTGAAQCNYENGRWGELFQWQHLTHSCLEDDHHHDEKGQEGAEAAPKAPPSVEEITTYVDEILEEDDKDKDGYINWSEFRMAQSSRNDKDKEGQQQSWVLIKFWHV